MMKHALAVALLGIGIGVTSHAPVYAAAPLSGVAVSSMKMADDTVMKVGGICPDEIPVVQGVIVFFQLLRRDEIDRDCYKYHDADDYDRQTYDERDHPSYKDDGYAYKDRGHAQPKDLKGSLR